MLSKIHININLSVKKIIENKTTILEKREQSQQLISKSKRSTIIFF